MRRTYCGRCALFYFMAVVSAVLRCLMHQTRLYTGLDEF